MEEIKKKAGKTLSEVIHKDSILNSKARNGLMLVLSETMTQTEIFTLTGLSPSYVNEIVNRKTPSVHQFVPSGFINSDKRKRAMVSFELVADFHHRKPTILGTQEDFLKALQTVHPDITMCQAKEMMKLYGSNRRNVHDIFSCPACDNVYVKELGEIAHKIKQPNAEIGTIFKILKKTEIFLSHLTKLVREELEQDKINLLDYPHVIHEALNGILCTHEELKLHRRSIKYQ